MGDYSTCERCGTVFVPSQYTQLHKGQTAEILRLRAENAIAERFHGIAVKERDLERVTVDRLRAENAELRATLDNWDLATAIANAPETLKTHIAGLEEELEGGWEQAWVDRHRALRQRIAELEAGMRDAIGAIRSGSNGSAIVILKAALSGGGYHE